MKSNKNFMFRLLLVIFIYILPIAEAEQLSLSFDFSNYVIGTQPDQTINNTGTVFDGLLSGMLYQDIVIGLDYDIDAVLSSTSEYAGNYDRNGSVGSDIQINQTINQLTSYNLSFYESGTVNLFDFENLNYSLSLYDIDGSVRNGNRTETIEFLTDGEFQLTETSTVDQLGEATFANQNVGNVPNPVEGATDLSAEQENASIIGTFENQNSIDFVATTGGRGGNRNIFIDGGDFIEFDSTTAPPAAPAPPIVILAIFMALAAFKSKVQK